MSMTKSFVYKWTHLPTLKWYVGSRTAIGCHPDDGYLCSSKIVKPMIKANPEEWKREIIDTGTIDAMRILESEILQLFDAKADPRSFNDHNCDPKFRYDKTGMKESAATCKKKSKSKLGIKRPEHGDKLRGRKRPEFGLKMKGRQAGSNNPSATKHIFTSPTGEIIHSDCYSQTCRELGLPCPTGRDIMSGKFKGTKGPWVGWKVEKNVIS